jgi:hypothetical protein
MVAMDERQAIRRPISCPLERSQRQPEKAGVPGIEQVAGDRQVLDAGRDQMRELTVEASEIRVGREVQIREVPEAE